MKNTRTQNLMAAALACAGPFVLAVVGATSASAQAPQQKPNIVFILMDNLGYGEVGVYGGGILRGAATPSIDKLAAEGTRLLNFNVEAQCTPSRSAIMTGRYAIRSGTHSVPFPGQLDGLTQWEVTIAELLSGQGYATAQFGKWHLGSDQSRLPTSQGFDEWFGIPRTTDEALYPSASNDKSVMNFGGTLASPSTAYLYNWNMLPIGQMLWTKHLMSYKEFPPLQAPETYNLEGILKAMQSEHGKSD